MFPPERSFERISEDDLQRLGELARRDREDFFQRHPQYKLLADRVLAVALCQGAALHFVDSKNGVKDFDVWTFYAEHPDVTYPPRRYTFMDFGDAKFGTSPDRPEFVGRRVDLLGRSLNVAPGTEPVEALRRFLGGRKSASATKLAEKAVVLIEPIHLLGTIVWKPG